MQMKTPQRRSDDPRKGGRVGSDVRGSRSTEITEINHNHEQDITDDAIGTPTDKLRTVESTVFTFIRNLRTKSHEIISNIIKRDHTEATSEAKFEVAEQQEQVEL